jgi:hypothetical protein
LPQESAGLAFLFGREHLVDLRLFLRRGGGNRREFLGFVQGLLGPD